MDMREQFEEWITSYIGETWLKRNAPEPDEYLDENAQFMWEAWQASRSVIVVVLPDAFWPCYAEEDEPGLCISTSLYTTEQITEALAEQGITAS